MNDLYLEYQTDLEEKFFLEHDRDATDEELIEMMQEYSIFQWAETINYSREVKK